MKIPIRMVYARRTREDEPLRVISEVCAEVPDALIAGTLAQAGRDAATAGGRSELADEIDERLRAAVDAGKLMTM